MQIRALDGSMHQVTQAQLQKAYKMLPHHPSAKTSMNQMEMQDILQDMKKRACDYKQKAAHNIQRIACLKSFPTTEDDVKTALVMVLRNGPAWALADLMYEAIQFQAARFTKHLISKYME